jgi:TolB protein
MMGRLWLIAVALLLVEPALAGEQPDRPTVEIAPGKLQAYRVAVQRFADRAVPSIPSRAGDLRESVEAALRLSGVLLPIPSEAFLGEESSSELRSGPRYDCADWTQSGADALVEGQISIERGRLAVEFAVWDTARCKRLARQTLSRPPGQGPLLARQVADQIVAAFTGTRGSAATEIAYISTRTGDEEVFVMNADGSNPRPATRSRSIKLFPDWLPDGGGILYTAYGDGAQPSLYMTARTPGVRAGAVLRGLFSSLPKYRGVFDPSGETLALVTSVDDSAEIFLVRRDGKKLRRLTKSPSIDISPAWSPDGKQLVFVSDRSGTPQLYIVDRNGENLRRLTYQGVYNTSPVWSPDGRWIAYETRLEGQFDIWLVDTTGDINLPLVQHRRSDESPSWSPDGRKIAFSSERRGRPDIYVMDVSGENLRRLTRGAGENKQPNWGPFPR